MSTAVPSISFQASWTDDLRPSPDTLPQTISRIAWDIFSILLFPIGMIRMIGWGVHFIVRHFTLPSTWLPHDHRIAKLLFQSFLKQIEPSFDAQTHFIKTPDNVTLRALHFKHKQASSDAPTILFFHSNTSYIEQNVNGWLIQAAEKHPCHFVLFNYRGLADFNSPYSANDLKIDGETIYQFVHNKLQVPNDKIHWFGWSLGGGIATATKARHPECTGPLCSIRSFSETKEVIRRLCSNFWLRWLPWAVEMEGWNLQAPVTKVTGPLMIVYHPQDEVIPFEASAYKAAQNGKQSFQALELRMTAEEEAKNAETIAFGLAKKIDHHSEPLERYIGARQAIADFVLPVHTLNQRSSCSHP